ncbi:expressed unknown protein [Seminavis robusta]|uniref:Beta-lactamase-related domain-containing protein n=1 Tax=Seminavis robusta TaxID=568900 RepID=A0A9N8HKC9_9STRA|nr:expressed unknown protein [Seminavis robusta]|eukprot:Sro607_g174670.1 n/a (99) ;mRNA; f:36183-36479
MGLHANIGLALKSRSLTAKDKVDQYATKLVQELNLPGLAVTAGALNDDGVFQSWSAGYGYANTEAQLPVTVDTSFWIASITKTILAVAVMRAVETDIL